MTTPEDIVLIYLPRAALERAREEWEDSQSDEYLHDVAVEVLRDLFDGGDGHLRAIDKVLGPRHAKACRKSSGEQVDLDWEQCKVCESNTCGSRLEVTIKRTTHALRCIREKGHLLMVQHMGPGGTTWITPGSR